MNPPFRGLFAAPLTPFHQDGQLRLEEVPRQADALLHDRVHGAFICGTTGEGLSLTLPERKALAETWLKAAANRLPVIVHVGHTCPASAQELAAHAASIGAAAIAAIPPIFYKPAALEDLVDYCALIARAAPSLPFIYYHIPSMTGVSYPMHSFLERARLTIPSLAGVKFSHHDLADLRACLTDFYPDYQMMFGRDEMLLAAVALGADCAVGSTYNFAAPLYHELMSAYHKGDFTKAQDLQSQSVALVARLQQFPVLAACKEILSWRGIQAGPVRPPLRNLSMEQRKELERALRRQMSW